MTLDRTNQKHERVFDAALESPKKIIRQLSRESHLSYSTARPLTIDLGSHSHTTQVLHTLTPANMESSKTYCAHTLAESHSDPMS